MTSDILICDPQLSWPSTTLNNAGGFSKHLELHQEEKILKHLVAFHTENKGITSSSQNVNLPARILLFFTDAVCHHSQSHSVSSYKCITSI